MSVEPGKVEPLKGLRVVGKFGDSVTTDHISPAGAIGKDTPAGKYLQEKGVSPRDFNSYGSRRGNHEVMMRGTFANIRIKNQIAPGTEGGFTTYLPTGEVTSIYDACMKYKEDKTGLVVLAGKDYGMGSSRDWPQKEQTFSASERSLQRALKESTEATLYSWVSLYFSLNKVKMRIHSA